MPEAAVSTAGSRATGRRGADAVACICKRAGSASRGTTITMTVNHRFICCCRHCASLGLTRAAPLGAVFGNLPAAGRRFAQPIAEQRGFIYYDILGVAIAALPLHLCV